MACTLPCYLLHSSTYKHTHPPVAPQPPQVHLHYLPLSPLLRLSLLLLLLLPPACLGMPGHPVLVCSLQPPL